MRQSLLIISIFAIGIGFGFVAALLLPLPPTMKQFAEQYTIRVFEQAELARELKKGKHIEIGDQIEKRFPEWAITIHNDRTFQNSPMGVEALQHIKRYYTENSIPIPEEIRLILNDLPEEDRNLCPAR